MAAVGWPSTETFVGIAGGAILLVSIIVVLAGLEGFILIRSIFWWLSGLLLGTAGTIGLGWWFWTGDLHVAPPTAVLAALVAAGILVGILGGRIAVLLSWMFWKASVFLFGFGLGGVLWLALYRACSAAVDPGILWTGAVLAGAGVGASWVLAFRAVFPVTWFLQNVLGLAGAAVILVPGGVADEAIAAARLLPGSDLALLSIIDALSGAIRDLGGAVLRIPWLLPAALGASGAFVALAMWVQRFPSRFGGFYDGIFTQDAGRFAILGLYRSALETFGRTVSSLARFRRIEAGPGTGGEASG